MKIRNDLEWENGGREKGIDAEVKEGNGGGNESSGRGKEMWKRN